MDITPVLMQQKRLGERGAGAETELKGEVKRLKIRECQKINGADYRNRTGDLLITSQLLYLLS